MKTRYSLTERGTSLDWCMGAFLRSTNKESLSWPKILISTAAEPTTLLNSICASLLQPFNYNTHRWNNIQQEVFWFSHLNTWPFGYCYYSSWNVRFNIKLITSHSVTLFRKRNNYQVQNTVFVVLPGRTGPGFWGNTWQLEERSDPALHSEIHTPSSGECSQLLVATQADLLH